jgi:hypothetical protein
MLTCGNARRKGFHDSEDRRAFVDLMEEACAGLPMSRVAAPLIALPQPPPLLGKGQGGGPQGDLKGSNHNDYRFTDDNVDLGRAISYP